MDCDVDALRYIDMEKKSRKAHVSIPCVTICKVH